MLLSLSAPSEHCSQHHWSALRHSSPGQVLCLPRFVRVQVPHVHLLQAHRTDILLAHDGPAPNTQLMKAVLAGQLPHRLTSTLATHGTHDGVTSTCIDIPNCLHACLSLCLSATSLIYRLLLLLYGSAGHPCCTPFISCFSDIRTGQISRCHWCRQQVQQRTGNTTPSHSECLSLHTTQTSCSHLLPEV